MGPRPSTSIARKGLIIAVFVSVCSLLSGCGGGGGGGGSSGGTSGPTSSGPSLVLSTPAAITVDACSSVTVSAIDANSNPFPVSSNTVVTLFGAGASGAYYTTSGCTVTATSVTIAASSSSATIWYHKSSAGTATLRASATGLTSASQSVSVSVGTTNKLVFTTAPATLAAGTVSNSCYNFQVTSEDDLGNVSPIAGSALTVSLSDGGAGGTFYSNSACTNTVIPTMSVGASTLSFYYNIPSSSPGNSVTLSVTSSLAVSSTTRSVTVSSGVAKKLVMSGSATGIVGGCYSYTIKAEDESNFVETSGFPAVTVQLSNSLNGSFYAGSTCAGGPITSANISAGASSVVVSFSKPSTGTDSLTATDAAGILTASSVSTNISSGTAQALAFSSGSSSQNMGACGNFTIQSRDENSQPSLISGSAEIIGLSDGSNGSFYLGSGCSGSAVTSAQINIGASSVAISYSKPTTGSVTLVAAGTGMFTASKNFALSVGTPAAKLVFIGTLTPSVDTCTAYSLQSQNSSSVATNVASTTVVTLSSEITQGGFYSDAACNIQISTMNLNSGANTVTVYVLDASPDSVTLTGTATGLTAAALPINF